MTAISLASSAGLTTSDLPEWVWDFAHAPGTKVHAGLGAVAMTGALVREMGVTRVLVVTDPGIRRAGHLGPVVESLEAAGVEVSIFDGVVENPTTETVDEAVAAVRAPGATVGAAESLGAEGRFAPSSPGARSSQRSPVESAQGFEVRLVVADRRAGPLQWQRLRLITSEGRFCLPTPFGSARLLRLVLS